jgi:hypothetical protein
MSWDAANNDVRWERVFKKIPWGNEYQTW